MQQLAVQNKEPTTSRAADVQAMRRAQSPDLLPITFVVLTKNEERDLPGCLDSIQGLSDDIHVLDSGSTDETVTIAESRGIPVHVHPFHGFGAQRNWAIDHIPHQYDWVFHLDADERFTPALAAEIRHVLDRDPSDAGYFVPSKLLFQGQWLRRAGGYPTYQVRFFHRQRLRFADYGHGQREVTQGSLGYLREPYLHDAFSKGLDEWLRKHVGYACREADHHFAEVQGGFLANARDLLTPDRMARRRALKRFSFHLPCRATLRYIEVLVLRRALLDGRAGIAYARMLAAYEAMIAARLAALRCEANCSPSHVGDGARGTHQPLATPRRPR